MGRDVRLWENVETPLKQTPDFSITAVIGLSVDAIDMPHEARHVWLMRMQNKMVVVIHQAVSKD
jgi:hypothetical protein